MDFLPGILLSFLASIEYHFKNFLSIGKNTCSPTFSILQNRDLQKIKNLVTIEPTDMMLQPTGIPTHYSQEEKMDRILLHNIDFLDLLKCKLL